ncbi:MAG: hypothetical protein DDT19_01769 [Syntrophomonadaceae bacterium]|nr:hypothetical protein [Bacillota bacterium]
MSKKLKLSPDKETKKEELLVELVHIYWSLSGHIESCLRELEKLRLLGRKLSKEEV